jgi:hypothetical protein
MDKFSALKAAALAATPGPWRALSYDDRLGIDGDGGQILVCEHITKQRPQDALFIAAANPAVILALLAELEAPDEKMSSRRQEVLRSLTERAEVAEAKLATPIKIVNYDEFFICHVSGASDDYCKGWVDGRNAAARDVGKAGFTVGDE